MSHLVLPDVELHPNPQARRVLWTKNCQRSWCPAYGSFSMYIWPIAEGRQVKEKRHLKGPIRSHFI